MQHAISYLNNAAVLFVFSLTTKNFCILQHHLFYIFAIFICDECTSLRWTLAKVALPSLGCTVINKMQSQNLVRLLQRKILRQIVVELRSRIVLNHQRSEGKKEFYIIFLPTFSHFFTLLHDPRYNLFFDETKSTLLLLLLAVLCSAPLCSPCVDARWLRKVGGEERKFVIRINFPSSIFRFF